ncbi:hypothetical protein MSAN_02273200 [Mycena sanguinolenta]|uniref:Protein kinase domain-containing protein n=1 Tax=Mycena sanguinolenta TaxID=230812 RepID=A0A8H6X9Z4_9AGAR|nr:hypothetical protein MSAN_02273200 [Mycena sanguinolenta]
MDPQGDSEADFIVVSTSDCTESSLYSSTVFPQASGLTRNAKFFVNSIPSLPSFLGGMRVTELQTSETSRTPTRNYSETIDMQAVDRLVTNYNYYISGGVGGRGGDAQDKGTGGGGGAGHGPTFNVYNSSQGSLSPFFRTIHLGDIKLKEKICLDGQSGLICRRNRGAAVRRMYSAELVAHESGRGTERVTVALYEGDDAEKEWQQDHAKYEEIRHPNILQLYGLVNTKKLCAIVFHEELIPYKQFLHRFESSPILTTYILGYCLTEWAEAVDYHRSNFPMANLEGVYDELPLWIRPATGQLCVDLRLGQGRDNILLNILQEESILRLENISLDDPNAEALVISSLDTNKYHELCYDDPIAQFRRFSISPRRPIWCWLTLYQLDSERGTLLMHTKPLDFGPEVELAWGIYGVREHEVLPNSWMRYLGFKLLFNPSLTFFAFSRHDAHQAHDLYLHLSVYGNSSAFWLAQANYIFSQLQTASDFEDYVLLNQVVFRLRCLHNLSNTQQPDGYLFVCPAEDFRAEENSFKWPDCPAYWSLDPCGTVPLSAEDAEMLGFPMIHIETFVEGFSWKENVYQGLRQFHAGRGFNPDSKDAARHLGYPLLELSSERVSLVECVELK